MITRRQSLQNKAYKRAETRLRLKYQKEFKKLLNEEKERLGLAPETRPTRIYPDKKTRSFIQNQAHKLLKEKFRGYYEYLCKEERKKLTPDDHKTLAHNKAITRLTHEYNFEYKVIYAELREQYRVDKAK